MDFQKSVFFQPGRIIKNDKGKSGHFDPRKLHLKYLFKSETHPVDVRTEKINVHYNTHLKKRNNISAPMKIALVTSEHFIRRRLIIRYWLMTIIGKRWKNSCNFFRNSFYLCSVLHFQKTSIANCQSSSIMIYMINQWNELFKWRKSAVLE